MPTPQSTGCMEFSVHMHLKCTSCNETLNGGTTELAARIEKCSGCSLRFNRGTAAELATNIEIQISSFGQNRPPSALDAIAKGGKDCESQDANSDDTIGSDGSVKDSDGDDVQAAGRRDGEHALDLTGTNNIVLTGGDGPRLTKEDVKAALTLVNLAGTDIGMEDVDAGLALLDPKRGSRMTLEEYLLKG